MPIGICYFNAVLWVIKSVFDLDGTPVDSGCDIADVRKRRGFRGTEGFNAAGV